MFSMYKVYLYSYMVLALTGLLVGAPAWGQDGGGANFGSPEAVENRIAEDRRGREQPLKERLGESGVNLALDYSAVALSASDVLPGSDDNLRYAQSRMPWSVPSDQTQAKPQAIRCQARETLLLIPRFRSRQEPTKMFQSTLQYTFSRNQDNR